MTIWESMGFRDNPYDARYLQPTEEDFKLFVGREDEARRFRTTTSSRRGLTVIVEKEMLVLERPVSLTCGDVNLTYRE